MAEPTFGFNSTDVARIAKTVRAAERGGTLGTTGPGSVGGLPTIYARLVDEDETDHTKWSWQQVVRQNDGSWSDGDLVGELTDGPAFRIDAGAAATDAIVVLLQLPEVQEDGTVLLKWAFLSLDMPRGQYPGQFYGQVSTNETGFAYIFAHDII